MTTYTGVIPEKALIRISVIVGDYKRPELIPLLKMSRASWYLGIAEGRYPPPIHLGGKTRGSYWRYSDILKLLDELAAPKPKAPNSPIRKPKASLRLLDKEAVELSEFAELFDGDAHG